MSRKDSPEPFQSLPESNTRRHSFFLNLRQSLISNLAFRSAWTEVSGAMGDLGTFIPIVLSLTLVNGLDLGTTLVFTGVYNIITGAVFGVPMPVQPMKAIAAAAISAGKAFTVPQIMAAGILTGAALFVLGVTGLMELANRLIPLPVVRGIQLAQGLNFAMTAVQYIRYNQNFSTGKSAGNRSWIGLDGLLLAFICFGFIAIITSINEDETATSAAAVVDDELAEEGRHVARSRRIQVKRFIGQIPSAFIVFVLGVVLAVLRDPAAAGRGFKVGPSDTHLVKITATDWWAGFVNGAVPQLPLSILNSVIATCKLSRDLFPEKAQSNTVTRVSISVGLMNLVGCWFGALPSCHGAGGLAGQYKFGGRSGGCVALLGLIKLMLGLIVGGSIIGLLRQFPVGLLGVLLLYAGIELAAAARDMDTKLEWFVMLVCASVSLVGSSAALGFVCAMVAHFLVKLKDIEFGRGCFWSTIGIFYTRSRA